MACHAVLQRLQRHLEEPTVATLAMLSCTVDLVEAGLMTFQFHCLQGDGSTSLMAFYAIELFCMLFLIKGCATFCLMRYEEHQRSSDRHCLEGSRSAISFVGMIMHIEGLMILGLMVTLVSQSEGLGHHLLLACSMVGYLVALVAHRKLQMRLLLSFRPIPVRRTITRADLEAAQCGVPHVEVRTGELLEDAPEACLICLESLSAGDEAAELSCGHCFHRQCLEKWLFVRPVCPMRCHITNVLMT